MMTHRKAKLEKFTPDKASRLLAIEGPQRNVSQIQVRRMAADMREGRWADCYRMIEIDANGHVSDGQHRLTAVIASNTEQAFYTVRGLVPTTIVTTDMGGKATNKADTAKRSGLEISSMNIAVAAANQIIQYEEWPEVTWGSRTVPSPSIALEELREWETTYQEGVSAVGSKAKFIKATQSSLLAMYMLIERTVGQGDVFVDQMVVPMASGANLGPGDPRLTLRNFLITAERRTVGLKKQQNTLILWIRAWNLLTEGEEMQGAVREPSALPMPEIKVWLL